MSSRRSEIKKTRFQKDMVFFSLKWVLSQERERERDDLKAMEWRLEKREREGYASAVWPEASALNEETKATRLY